MPLLHGRSVGQFDTEPARYPLQAQSGSCRRTCVTLHRPASRRSPKGVGPESFSAPERVDRAGDLVQPGVQPGLGLAVNLSGRRDSNPRRPAWEAGILPLNYARVREGRGTINRDIQNCLGRIGLNLLRPVNLTFARSISNIGFAAGQFTVSRCPVWRRVHRPAMRFGEVPPRCWLRPWSAASRSSRFGRQPSLQDRNACGSGSRPRPL